ncbi:gastrula zinc finger protein XlCGF52.1-like isoform X3 [Schistocerca serialis cubense]|uniref:gastrula zinc finger protein XlCGF52.1-like isoform X3 n=1 Tax=Schistocerca serialis cubense TaxID=2023355 RepID=UPI00214E3ACC|nr:gastrula zinc finger protein XlCGF52.1-like isoform X3 [Schistocerca serialis cubense]
MDMAPEQHASSAFDVMMAIKQEPEMASGQHTSSICDSVTIKQEPVSNINVEADTQVSPKQEVEYISVKEEPPGLQEWEVPECHSSAQDPLSFTKEECSPSEDYLGPVTYNIVKTENEEDEEEAASEDDGQELKNEMESTSSEPESTLVLALEDTNATDDAGECPYTCGLCNKTFTQRKSLKLHLETHTVELPYSCGVCNRRFTSDKRLKRHSRLHTGERLYSCGVCSKSFMRSDFLKNHLRVHTGTCYGDNTDERPYTCCICNKTFMKRNPLKKHLKRHTIECLYTCDVCNKTFAKRRSLKQHLRLHTSEHTYSYNVFNKTSVQSGNQKRHLMQHRGKRPYRWCVQQNSHLN